MLKKTLVFVVVCILIFPLGLTAKEKPGAKLVIQKKDGQQVKGELITVKNSSLLLLSESGADVTVDVKDIKVITVVKESKAWLGAKIGFLTSVGLGVGYSFKSSSMAILYGILAAIPAAILGAYVGGAIGIDKTIQIEGKSDPEIQESLEYMREKARIPDYN